jgi:aminoglycoside phosphotransferase (APT) family kinase protein
MAHVDGVVPPDLMPYPFGGNWLFDASPDEQVRLQRRSVEVLAELHAVDVSDDACDFLRSEGAGTPLRRHVDGQRAYYEWVVADSAPSPLIERGLDWLEHHWPKEETEAVLSWGDSRIGNIMYRQFEPVAVLDWEMVGVGPREIDLGWMIFLHRFFQDLAEQYGFPGMPEFMRTADVVATYRARTGVTPSDLEWYLAYAAVRHGIIMYRINHRLVRFGEATPTDDPDDMINHRSTIEQMLDGTYWSRL